MKFFKYLILIITSLISFNSFAYYLAGPSNGAKTYRGETASQACTAYASATGKTFAWIDSGACMDSNGSAIGTYQFFEDKCEAGASNVYSGSVTIQNWKDDNEYVNLVDSALAKFTGTTVCSNSCIHKFDFLGSGEGDSANGPVSFKGKYVSTAQTCTSPTQGPTDTLNGTKTPTTEGCKNGEAYCAKPPTGCPSGYVSGSYNGKEICVKNNPDPTKPNPNDPNNGGSSNFDDSRIIAAINDSKNAITSSINNAVNSISSSINSINQSISNVTSAINGTTNAVNTNTNAVNAVKSSVDALHNTINAVTTAVNNNTTAVTSAVNSNTTATNAVKASVDALNSTVSAVTTAVEKNTTAVNANGDKVANAVKDNTTATNAVKTAVENLNASVNAVTDSVNSNGDKVANETKATGDKITNAVNSVKNAVENLNNAVNAVTNAVNASGEKVSNAVNSNGDKITNAINTNGKNTVDAIDKGTEATNENGKKLDKIDKNGKDLNDFVMGCKTDSSGNKTCSDPFEGQEEEDGKVEILENEIDNKFDGSILNANASCPAPMQIRFTLFQTHTLTYSYETMCNIASFIRPIIIFIGMFVAFLIVTGQRSSHDA